MDAPVDRPLRDGRLADGWGKIVLMGSGDKGFFVEVNPVTRVVFLRVWGQWEEADGRAYVEYFKGKVAPVLGTTWYVVADISAFPPQSEPVNAQIQRTMELATKGGMAKAANIVSSAMTQLQIKRLSQEMNIPEFAFFTERAEAEAWVVH